MRPRNDILPCVIQELVDYHPKTGKIYWKYRDIKYFNSEQYQKIWNTRYAGKEAFCGVSKNGYFYGAIFGRNHYAHRVAFCAFHGYWPEYVDHINHDRLDNRIENIRDVTFAENRRNQKARKGCLFTGITKRSDSPGRPWFVRLGREKSFIGCFACLGQAIKARKAAEKSRGYHENHGTTPKWIEQSNG